MSDIGGLRPHCFLPERADVEGIRLAGQRSCIELERISANAGSPHKEPDEMP